MALIETVQRARDSRFARKPDRRGRGAALRRHGQPCRCSERCVDWRVRGRTSCATATPSATSARVSQKAVEAIIEEIADEIEGIAADDQRILDRCCSSSTAARTRRTSARTPFWASRLQSRRPLQTPLSLPLYRYLGGPNAFLLPVPMMNVINGGAHADTNVDIQEFMIVPTGAETFGEAPPLGRRDLPRAEEPAQGEGPLDRPRRRGRLRSRPREQPRGARPASWRRSRRRASSPATTSRSASTSQPPSSSRTAPTPSRAKKRSAEAWPRTTRSSLPTTRSCRSKTRSTRTTGTAGQA